MTDPNATDAREPTLTPAAGLDSNVTVVALRPGPNGIETERRDTHNVTCVGGHEALLAGINPKESGATAARLAIGTGGSGGTAPTDRSLNTPLGTATVRIGERQGRVLTLRAFAPGQLTSPDPVDELGIALGPEGNGDLVNHATITGVDKSSPDIILVVAVELTVADVSE